VKIHPVVSEEKIVDGWWTSKGSQKLTLYPQESWKAKNLHLS